jgi:hypothetical protein
MGQEFRQFTCPNINDMHSQDGEWVTAIPAANRSHLVWWGEIEGVTVKVH